MKKITHIINIILSLLWMTSSICILVFASPYEGNDFVIALFGFVSLVMAFATLIYGSMAPSKDTYLSEKHSKIIMIFVTIGAVINKLVIPETSLEVLSGERAFKRSWMPVMYLILIIIESPVLMLAFFTENVYLKYSIIAMSIIMVFLLIASSIWFVEHCKEMGNRHPVKTIVKQYVIVIAIFGIGIIGSLIIHKDDNKSYIDRDKLQSNLNNIQDKLDSINSAEIFDKQEFGNIDRDELQSNLNNVQDKLDSINSAEIFNKKEFEKIEDIFLMIYSEFDNQKIYYKLQEINEQKLNIIVWTDEEDGVYIYQFTKENDKYIKELVFQSEKIKKEDLQGKETGIIEP